MKPDSYDIAIIGAGPAGSTLARLLSRRYRVLLVERRNLEELDGRLPKVCGGLLAPDAQAILARLGLGIPKDVLVGPQIFGVRTLDLASGRERFYPRNYLNIDRERLDRWIFAQVPESVERRLSTVLVGGARDPEGFTLTLRRGKAVGEIRARLVVGADGARSRARELLPSPWIHTPRSYLAVQEWFELQHPPAHFGVFFDHRLADFYGWTIPKEDTLILGLALPSGSEVLPTFRTLQSRLEPCGFSFGRSIRREGHPILRPRFWTRVRSHDEPLLLIGEAGGFISPSSAEGLSYAFRSALAASEVLNEALEESAVRFEKATAGLQWNLRMKNLKAPFLYQPTLRNLVMASGIRHLEQVDGL